ncbi:MAG: hypothetical protein ACI38Q_05860 [Candidatus Bruticola sp.]
MYNRKILRASLLFPLLVAVLLTLGFTLPVWSNDGKLEKELDIFTKCGKERYQELTPERINSMSNQKLLDTYNLSVEAIEFCRSLSSNKELLPDQNVQIKAQQCERINYKIAKKIEPELRRRSLNFKPVKVLLH